MIRASTAASSPRSVAEYVALVINRLEPNCSYGCPSFTPVIDRSIALASQSRSILPTELVEEERIDGVLARSFGLPTQTATSRTSNVCTTTMRFQTGLTRNTAPVRG
jgi:hypothetical protein